jgi:hypothetical protein
MTVKMRRGLTANARAVSSDTRVRCSTIPLSFLRGKAALILILTDEK